MVTFWFQVCEGACFAHGWRNFDAPRFAPTQFHHLYLHEEDCIHSCLFFLSQLIFEEDYIHSYLEPNPTVRGRGVSTKAPRFEKRSSTVSAGLLAWFLFSIRTCRFLDWCGVFFCECFTVDRRRRLAYPFLGIIDIYICLGTRIGIWFIHTDCFDIIHIYRCLRCDAGERFGSFVAGVAAFVLC